MILKSWRTKTIRAGSILPQLNLNTENTDDVTSSDHFPGKISNSEDQIFVCILLSFYYIKFLIEQSNLIGLQNFTIQSSNLLY